MLALLRAETRRDAEGAVTLLQQRTNSELRKIISVMIGMYWQTLNDSCLELGVSLDEVLDQLAKGQS